MQHSHQDSVTFDAIRVLGGGRHAVTCTANCKVRDPVDLFGLPGRHHINAWRRLTNLTLVQLGNVMTWSCGGLSVGAFDRGRVIDTCFLAGRLVGVDRLTGFRDLVLCDILRHTG